MSGQMSSVAKADSNDVDDDFGNRIPKRNVETQTQIKLVQSDRTETQEQHKKVYEKKQRSIQLTDKHNNCS